MAKRKASNRTTVNTGTDKRYVRRSATGRFKESEDVGRSLQIKHISRLSSTKVDTVDALGVSAREPHQSPFPNTCKIPHRATSQ